MSELNNENGSSRRSFLKTLAGASGCLLLGQQNLLAAVKADSAHQIKRPNFVCFLGEGLRPDELSYSGNKIIHTPNLDRIASEGMTFRNAFVVNALCLPSRATVMTGLYSHTTGAVDNAHDSVPAKFPIIPDMLREAGYEVAFVGKSHVAGGFRDHYWDYYFGFEGQTSYYDSHIYEGIRGSYTGPKHYTDYVDNVLTKKAVDWLNQKHDKPFCLFVWFYAPHAPFYRPRSMDNDLNGVAIPKPDTYDANLAGYPGKPRAFVDAHNKIGTSEVGKDDPRSLEELVKDHYVGVLSNDRDVGEILGALEGGGHLDDTAILLSSDHGFFLGEWHMYDKRFMHEPSIRVPMSIRYPRMIAPGTFVDKMALNLDIAPTMLELAGIEVPKEMQGHSLVPFLKGGHPHDWRTAWLYEYYEYPGFEQVLPNRGVRTDRYKYIHYYEAPEEFELYDLVEDPEEKNNLYWDPRYKDLLHQMQAKLEELRKETNDTYVYPFHPAAKKV
ncbi:MAG: sulfatase family protein [Acidobacteriaceae bacterium]